MAGQGRAQGRVGTWPLPGTAGAAPWLVPVAGLDGRLAATLRAWMALELAPGRLMPWLLGWTSGDLLRQQNPCD